MSFRQESRYRQLSNESLTGNGACSPPVGRLVLRGLILLGSRLVPDFLAMMLNDASRGCSYDGVPACNVTDHPTDGRAFQTAFCGSDA